ncbi:MAG: 3-hydroxyacyl-ACP dehydratase FabZ [Eubacteriales bacterium]
MFGIEEIKGILPHREPFLMLDKVLAHEPGKHATAVKAVSGNEWFFMGHFDETKIMPGVLILEALAQAGAVALMTLPEMAGKLAFLARVKSAKFSKKVVPGDLLRLETEITELRDIVGTGVGKAYVDDALVAKSEFVFAISDK